MGFPKPTLTNAGKQALLKTLAGKTLTFSSIKIGDGKVSKTEDLTKRASLVNLIHSFDIASCKKLDDTIELIATFSNDELNTDFEFREIGAYALEPGTGEEILYCYTNCGEEAEKIEATTLSFVEKTIKLYVAVGNAENVSVIINPDMNYVTKEEEKDLINSTTESILATMIYGYDDDVQFGDGFLIVGINYAYHSVMAFEYDSRKDIKVAFIPESTTEIGYASSNESSGYAFRRCENLKKVYFPSTLTRIRKYSFSGCYNLDDVVLPYNFEQLDEGAFSYCKSLKKIDLPHNVASIPDYAFLGCISLKSVNTGINTCDIGKSAFTASGLTSITVESQVTSIKGYAFENCSALKKVIIKRDSTTTSSEQLLCHIWDTNVFKGTPIADGTGFVYVPDALVEDYKSATNWTVYADQIRPISELESEEV